MVLVLLTGQRGCGKTTACGRLAELAHEHALVLGGVIAPPIYDEAGTKTGIMMRDMASGQERQLAQVVDIDSVSVTVGHYRFDDQVTAWGLDCIMRSLESAIDAVVIDEIGPLELCQGAGFAPALDLVPTMRARSAILLVRPSLVDDLRQRLEALSPMVIELNLANRDQVPQQLLAAIRA